MANPTTNFGWVMPTSSSLVTNLPADFNTFGQAVDTSMSELLGGTTGQVLSKTSNTSMDFTWVTPTDQTPLTTKGDLFTFTTVDARLAVGANGETLVADSSTSTGLRYTAGTVQANPVLNSAMQVWQRGTSFTPNASSYAADRWAVYTGTTGRTLTRQLTGDTTNLPFIQYCLRFARDSGNTNTSTNYLFQPFETINTIPFAGKTVTMSFYARKGANFSGSVLARLFTGTGTDQNPLVSYTGYASLISETPTLTTTWQRFTYTATVGATANEMTVEFDWTPSGTAGAADYYEITGVQLDIGSVALPFRTYAGTIQGELAACQRYYFRTTANATYPYVRFGMGTATATTSCALQIQLPVTMRSTVTTLGSFGLALYNSGVTAVTSLAADQLIGQSIAIIAGVASGLTTNGAYQLIANNQATAYLEIGAEL